MKTTLPPIGYKWVKAFTTGFVLTEQTVKNEPVATVKVWQWSASPEGCGPFVLYKDLHQAILAKAKDSGILDVLADLATRQTIIAKVEFKPWQKNLKRKHGFHRITWTNGKVGPRVGFDCVHNFLLAEQIFVRKPADEIEISAPIHPTKIGDCPALWVDGKLVPLPTKPDEQTLWRVTKGFPFIYALKIAKAYEDCGINLPKFDIDLEATNPFAKTMLEHCKAAYLATPESERYAL